MHVYDIPFVFSLREAACALPEDQQQLIDKVITKEKKNTKPAKHTAKPVIHEVKKEVLKNQNIFEMLNDLE